MNALILAAGKGERLLPFTENCPKCCVYYCGNRIIDYILYSLHPLNVKIVTGWKEDAINHDLNKVFNSDYETTNMAYSLFSNEDGNDMIVSYSDIIYTKECVQKLIDSPYDVSIVVEDNWYSYWKLRMDNPLIDVESLIIEDGLIIEIGKKKCPIENIHSQYTGLFRIKPVAWPLLRMAYQLLENKKCYLTDVFQKYIEIGGKIGAIRVNKQWMEFDSPSDLQIKNYLPVTNFFSQSSDKI